MNTFKKKIIFRVVLTILGGIAGYLYWHYVGCASGTCPITSRWYYSAIYGLVIGYLISGLFIPDKKKTDENQIIENTEQKQFNSK